MASPKVAVDSIPTARNDLMMIHRLAGLWWMMLGLPACLGGCTGASSSWNDGGVGDAGRPDGTSRPGHPDATLGDALVLTSPDATTRAVGDAGQGWVLTDAGLIYAGDAGGWVLTADGGWTLGDAGGWVENTDGGFTYAKDAAPWKQQSDGGWTLGDAAGWVEESDGGLVYTEDAGPWMDQPDGDWTLGNDAGWVQTSDGGLAFAGDAGGWVYGIDGGGWADPHGFSCLGGTAFCDVPCGADGGTTTTVSGTVYAPNGTLPVYNVLVYVPGGTLSPIAAGISCTQCEAPVSGSPLTSTYSDATGKFVLTNVPVGSDIPIVVQLGKWRRATTIPTVTACTNNVLTNPNLTRLPMNQSEGSMPHIALTTGTCDHMGCMLPDIGIAASEFGFEADGASKAVNVYTPAAGQITGATAEYGLWSNLSLLSTYDMGIFSCNCHESVAPGDPALAAVTSYLDNGGRIFTTDFQYTWYRYSPDPALGATSAPWDNTGIGDITGGAPGGASPITLDTSFPQGLALSQWMDVVYPSGTSGEVTCEETFANVKSLNARKTTTWASSLAELQPTVPEPRVFTVNTPVSADAGAQCGKGVHLDVHIDIAKSVANGYPATCTGPMTQDELMFAFLFFNLVDCVSGQTTTPPPPPPPPTPPPPPLSGAK